MDKPLAMAMHEGFRITPSHIALVKGWLNGLDLGLLSKRYLAPLGGGENRGDLRITKKVLSHVLRELHMTAVRRHVPDAATLFRNASSLAQAAAPQTASARLSYEDYLATLDDPGAFSDAELQESYESLHPPGEGDEDAGGDRLLKRKSRLIKRQTQLISDLTRLVGDPIREDDPLSGWAPAPLADLLRKAGLNTVFDLSAAVIEDPNWHRSIPGVGKSKAARIEGFLKAQPGLLDGARRTILKVRSLRPDPVVLNAASPFPAAAVPFSDVPVAPTAADLAPSPAVFLPGTPRSSLEANTDVGMLEAWLALKRSNATVVLYRREIGRLIAWSGGRGKSFRQLSVEDALAYRDFLHAQPMRQLVKKGPQRLDAYLPGSSVRVAGFTKPVLADSTTQKSLVVIGGFYRWLVEVGAMGRNPFAGVRVSSGVTAVGHGSTDANEIESLEAARKTRSGVLGRVLPKEVLDAIHSYFAREGSGTPFLARARFVFALASMTGLRISEMAAARRDHMEYIVNDAASDQPGGWVLHVVGKRGKHREVPLPDLLLEEMGRYFVHRGLSAPESPLDVAKGVFLVGPHPSPRQGGAGKSPADGVRPQVLHTTLKMLFSKVLYSSPFAEDASAEKLQAASAHWLRHTLATRSVAAGAPVDVVAGVLGHASISTTSIYIQAERHRKLAEMQRLWS